MEYVEPEKARDLPGLRLVLTTGVPGPWGEAAKSILHVKGIDYVPVRQTAGEANEALVAWTGHRNAPQAILDDEPPRIGWEEILMLAERIAPEPCLVPADERERAFMMGLCHEICSEDGFAWNRRLQLLAPMLTAPDIDTNPALESVRVLGRSYGWSPAALERAEVRICAVLRLLADQLARQAEAGHEYLMGASLSAIDIYWAAFANMVKPLPPELNPMPDNVRAGYGGLTPGIEAALDPALLAHRDRVFQRHLKLPLDF